MHNAFYLLLQLCLAALAFAAPMAGETMKTNSTPWQYGAGGGVVGFIVLILDLIVFSASISLYPPYLAGCILITPIVEVLKSNRPVPNKIIWCLVIWLLPVVGMIIYFLFSNRKAHNTYEPLP
jgi:hypothetical protein